MQLDEFLDELQEQKRILQKERDKQLLTRFCIYLNEHCGLHVEDMVERFLEDEEDV